MSRSGTSDDTPHGQLRLFAGDRDPAEYEAWMTAIRGAEAILFASAQPVGADELAERLADLLDTGELPDIASLRHLFSPARAEMPVVSVHLAPLNGYEALIGTAPAGEGA